MVQLCCMPMTSLGHKLFCVNQTDNLIVIVMYDIKNAVGF